MSLTQTAILVKQIIIISVVALVLGISGFIGYQIWHRYYIEHLPVIEEKPDAKFGLLSQPDFPKVATSTSNFTYSLDTITGGLPKVGIDPGFEKIIKVYFLTQTVATFLAPERSQNLAEKFDITSPPEILSETKFRFADAGKTLTVDLNNGNFSYINEATASVKTNLAEDSALISGFQQMLSTLGVMKENLGNNHSKVILFKTSNNELIPTQIRSEATVAQVSLWPNSIDNKPILTADFNRSLVNAVITGETSSLNNYFSLNFNYYPIELSTFATYPLKTAEAAFDDLKNGKGVVVVEPEKPQVSISSIYLGYYLPEIYYPYLQPIYIFEGQNFVAYVSAIAEQFHSGATDNLNKSNQ